MNEATPKTKGARRCSNLECEYGGRWTVRTITRLRDGKWLCNGKGCHTVYGAKDVIDPANDDYRLWVE